jgi:prephenate dehydrogenase
VGPLSAEPPFTRVAIIGVGLIGGSIALALRERWPSVRIVGVDRQPVLAHSLDAGAIDSGAKSIAESGDVDLIVLAAPVQQNVTLFPAVAAHAGSRAVITDVGGTKRDILRAAAAAPGARFVGGHPIGGAERGGFGFAGPDLFRGRPWILTEGTEPQALELVAALVSGFGAKPSVMDAVEHDRLMAFVSHLPQLTASALMDVVGAGAADGLKYAGRGLVDTTRLSSSPANIWREICETNGDLIAPALDAMIERLTELRNDLSNGSTLDRVFRQAALRRAELLREQD